VAARFRSCALGRRAKRGPFGACSSAAEVADIIVGMMADGLLVCDGGSGVYFYGLHQVAVHRASMVGEGLPTRLSLWDGRAAPSPL
jgi:hypothetical protein